MTIVRLERSGDYWRAVWLGSDGRTRRKGLGPCAGSKRQTHKAKLTESAARRACMELERKMGLAPAVRDNGKAPTLAAWLGKYLELRTDLSAGSVKESKTTGAYLVAHLGGEIRIDKISRVAAAGLRAHLAGQMSEQTVRKHMRNCKVLFGHAMKLDLIAFNPFDRQQSGVARVDKTWAYISDRKSQKILDACPDDSWRCLIALCRWAGLRRGEALRLDWPDIDWQARTLTVRHEGQQTTKRRQRVVPMVPALHDVLMARFNSAEPGDRPFGDDHHNLDKSFRAIIKRAEVTPWAKLFHTLRKNAETDWLATFPVMDVCDWLGHDPAVAAAHYHQTKSTTMQQVTGVQAEAEQSEIERLRARCRRLIEIARALQAGI